MNVFYLSRLQTRTKIQRRIGGETGISYPGTVDLMLWRSHTRSRDFGVEDLKFLIEPNVFSLSKNIERYVLNHNFVFCVSPSNKVIYSIQYRRFGSNRIVCTEGKF